MVSASHCTSGSESHSSSALWCTWADVGADAGHSDPAQTASTALVQMSRRAMYTPLHTHAARCFCHALCGQRHRRCYCCYCSHRCCSHRISSSCETRSSTCLPAVWGCRVPSYPSSTAVHAVATGAPVPRQSEPGEDAAPPRVSHCCPRWSCPRSEGAAARARLSLNLPSTMERIVVYMNTNSRKSDTHVYKE